MAKRKITVTVDEELVDRIRLLGEATMSSVVNAALGGYVERAARRAALADLLAQWERELGPIPQEERSAAHDAFDVLDAAAEERDVA